MSPEAGPACLALYRSPGRTSDRRAIPADRPIHWAPRAGRYRRRVADAAVPWRRTPQGRCILVAALLLLVVVGPIVQEYTAQPASRYPLTAAMVEDGTVSLEALRDIENLVLIDRLEVDGELYSDKAPGQPVLAIPAYVVAQLLGRRAGHRVPGRRQPRGLGGHGVDLGAPRRRPARPHGVGRPRHARPAAVLGPMSLSFGTLLLPFAAEMYGHVLAGLLGFAAWLVVRGDGRRLRRVGPRPPARCAAQRCSSSTRPASSSCRSPCSSRHARRSGSCRSRSPACRSPPRCSRTSARVLGSPFESSYSGKDGARGRLAARHRHPRPGAGGGDARRLPRPPALHAVRRPRAWSGLVVGHRRGGARPA